MGKTGDIGGNPMEKNEEIAELKKLARKAHEARQRRQYDIVRLYLEGWKKN